MPLTTDDVVIGKMGTSNKQPTLDQNRTINKLTLGSSTWNLLTLGSFGLTITSDYTNADWGTGNTFDPNKWISKTLGYINALNAGQQLTGTKVTNGTTANATLALGNIHVGDTATSSYQIYNSGTTTIRGAIQTNVNGANLTDSRLLGTGTNYTGVTAGNFGPIAGGASSSAYNVTFTGSSAGALDNQKVYIINNFENVTNQTLNITGAAYDYAAASMLPTTPITLANQRVGGSLTQALSITNTAATVVGYKEKLDASFGTLTGDANNNGGTIGLLAAGSPANTNLAVGVNTGTAGAKSGTAQVNFTSNGTGTSGLANSTLASQTVTVNGNVYRLATASAHTPEPVTLANVREGGTFGTQALTLQNTAASDGYSEKLNASISPTSGSASASGAFTLLAPQAINNSSLIVGLGGSANTATAGAKSGTATITLASDGTGTSGFTASGIGSQTVNIAGKVFRLASANALEPVNLGTVRVGESFNMQELSLTNTAANDGYSEKLNASFLSATDDATHNGGSFAELGAGSTNMMDLSVGLGNTGTAGAKSGTATIALASNGTTDTSGLGLYDLTSQTVTVTGMVNYWANPVFVNLGGLGTLNGSGTSYTLDLGTFTIGSAANTSLGLKNDVDEPADWLSGYYDTFSGDAAFLLSGFNSFDNLNAGEKQTGLNVALNTSTAGAFNYSLLLNAFSGNNSSYASLAGVTLNLTGKVAPVPIPSAAWLLASGMIGLIGIRRRRS
ncbi:MAG: hypothetical protein A2521_09600 [Deltaproteobacteria bacterium RIFOXYD12_FULL_57_12]|nr:MAG: hypothetical protein A2521_09600 [Deltaproteobacteria bacterium RIFOXYD12_FULL_57_12]